MLTFYEKNNPERTGLLDLLEDNDILFGRQRSAEEVGNGLKVLHDKMFVDGGNK